MKIILEFNLPEEKTEHLKAIKADDFLNVITDLKEYLRKQIKYNQKEHFVEIQEMLQNYLKDNCVNLEEFGLC